MGVGERLAWALYWAECWQGVILEASRGRNREKYRARYDYPRLRRWLRETPKGQACRAGSSLRRRMTRQMRAKVSRESMCGCTTMELRTYLEGLFKDGMSWENYGEWHIDHIRPCASFDLENEGDVRTCFHYTNLQPLWALDNIRKGAKIVSPETVFHGSWYENPAALSQLF